MCVPKCPISVDSTFHLEWLPLTQIGCLCPGLGAADFQSASGLGSAIFLPVDFRLVNQHSSFAKLMVRLKL